MELPKILLISLIGLFVLILFSGCTIPDTGQILNGFNIPNNPDALGNPDALVSPDTSDQPVQPDAPDLEWQSFSTFKLSAGEAEYVDGKPVIRLYSTTWCPHCQWIKEAFEQTVEPYVMEGKVVAYHWQLDIQDDTLTDEVEEEIPQSEIDLFYRFDPQGSVPLFVFGNKYYRIGNGYEGQKDLQAEKEEFQAVIEELIKNAPQ